MNVQRVAPLSGDSGIYVVVDIDDIWNIRVVVLSQLIAAVRCPSALRVVRGSVIFPYSLSRNIALLSARDVTSMVRLRASTPLQLQKNPLPPRSILSSIVHR